MFYICRSLCFYFVGQTWYWLWLQCVWYLWSSNCIYIVNFLIQLCCVSPCPWIVNWIPYFETSWIPWAMPSGHESQYRIGALWTAHSSNCHVIHSCTCFLCGNIALYDWTCKITKLRDVECIFKRLGPMTFDLWDWGQKSTSRSQGLTMCQTGSVA